MVQADNNAEQWLPAQLSALKSLWTDQLAAGNMPAEIFFCDAVMKPWKNCIAYIEREKNGRFLVHNCGSGLIRRFGREASGSYTDMLARDISDALSYGLERCVQTTAPYAARVQVLLGDRISDHIDLILPVELKKKPATHLVFASYELSSPF